MAGKRRRNRGPEQHRHGLQEQMEAPAAHGVRVSQLMSAAGVVFLALSAKLLLTAAGVAAQKEAAHRG